MMGRPSIIVMIGLAISALSLWVVGQSIDLAAVARYLERADLRLLALAVGVIGIQALIRAARWAQLIDVTPSLAARRLVAPLLVGYLGNAVLPARLGEPIRAVLVSRRERIGVVHSLGTVLLERIIDVASLAAVALIAAIAVGAPAWIVNVALVATTVGGIVVAALTAGGTNWLARLLQRVPMAAQHRAHTIIQRLAAALDGSNRRRSIAIAASLSFAGWALDASIFWLVAESLGIELSFLGAALVGAITVLGTAIPSAPGYVGTFELAATTVAVALGVPAEAAVAYALLAHGVTIIPIAVGGAVAVISLGRPLSDVVGDVKEADRTSAATGPA